MEPGEVFSIALSSAYMELWQNRREHCDTYA